MDDWVVSMTRRRSSTLYFRKDKTNNMLKCGSNVRVILNENDNFEIP